MRKVVITGIGIVSPVGNSLKEFWDALLAGKSGISRITRFDTTNLTVKIAAEVKNFDPAKYFTPRELRRMDRFTQYAMVAAIQAVEDSGIEFKEPYRAGVIIGSGIGGIETWEAEHKKLLESPRRVSPLFIPMMIMNTASAMVAMRWGLRGPNFGVVSACATSNHSIGVAYHIIKHGDADVMLAGGTEAAVTPLSIAGFANMKALSTRNDEPEKASRPFDRDRDGFVVGEGAAVFVLEEYEHAKKRGAKIYCELAGYGANCDAYHLTAPEPSGEVAADVMLRALKDAGVSPDEVDYINAHGTSTPLNDKTETLAIKKAFGERAYKIPISSTKSMIGHLLGAAGACEAVATVMTIKENVIHPTINLENPDPECDLDYVPKEPREKEVKVAISNSFGFGGHNACLVFRKI